MKLPIEISPNPLVVTSVEIRFDAGEEGKDIFSLLYPVLTSNLPTLEALNQIPREIKEKNPQLKYQPEFKLKNESFSLAIGSNSLLFEIIGTYPLWNSYFDFIGRNLKLILNTEIIKNIERVGVRYGSIFEQAEKSKALKYYPKIEIPGYEEKIVHNRYDLTTGNFNLHLQIAENAKIEIPNSVPKVGLYVDIDASYNSPMKPSEDLISIIDNLHTSEKELFFKILDDNFIKTLNPKYD